MGYDLSAVWYYGSHRVRIYPVFSQIMFVKPKHIHDISPGRVTGKIYSGNITSISSDIVHNPFDSSCGVIQDICEIYFRHKTVAHSDDDGTIPGKNLRNRAFPGGKPSAMEPYDDRAILRPFLVCEVKSAHLCRIIIILRLIKNIGFSSVALSAQCCR